MGEESKAPDVVIFFDANMPHMDKCSNNCFNKELVLCVHRLNFSAHLIYPGRKIDRLDDFQVLELFYDYILRQKLLDLSPKPFFVIVTKDHDFLYDAFSEYLKVKRKTPIPVKFYDHGVSLDDCHMRMVFIEHKNYGENHTDDFRRMITKLNNLFPVWRNS